jgi:outer membrane protein
VGLHKSDTGNSYDWMRMRRRFATQLLPLVAIAPGLGWALPTAAQGSGTSASQGNTNQAQAGQAGGDQAQGVKPPPVPTGVVPLPQGPPQTGLQAPLPAPAVPLPNPERPLKVSPGLQALNSYLQSRPLTINDAVAVALATNRSFATSVAVLLRAQGRTAEARAALNPTLGLGAQITEFDAPTTVSLSAFGGGASSGGAGGNSAPSTLIILNQFNPVLTANANLPLDVMGTLRAASSQAQFQEVAARIDVNRTRNQVVYDVKTAFYNVLRAQAQVRVATDNINNALNRLSDAQKNYAAGTAPRFDVITATTDVANGQQTLIQAKVQVSVNLAALKNVIGLDNRSPLRITDQGAVETPPEVTPPADLGAPPRADKSGQGVPNAAPPVDTPAPAPATTIGQLPVPPVGPGVSPSQPSSVGTVEDTIDLGPEYNNLLTEAMRTRPEILEADANIAAAQRGIQVARASELPSLSLGLGYTYTPNATGFSRANQGAATLSVSIPIFDGGLARARVREARASVADAQTNRRQAADQVSLDLQQAYLALLQARDQVQVANVGLTQAREAARLARVRYNAGVSQQAGVSPILELSNAQNSLAQAESNQVNALYNYNNARAQLDRAIGRYSYATQGPGYQAPPPPSVVPRNK